LSLGGTHPDPIGVDGSIAVPKKKNIRGWDNIAESYQRDHVISLEDVHYGPLIAGERQLRLLGDVENQWALEIGCGAGQNAVALSQWGAKVVAIEPSLSQLKYAKKLSKGIDNIYLVRGCAEELSAFRMDSFDLVLSSLAFDFVFDLEEVLRQVGRILKTGGRLVFSVIHPIMNCVGWHLMGDRESHGVENYFEMNGARHKLIDFKDGTREGLDHYEHTLEELFAMLADQGFRVTALQEPMPFDLKTLKKEERDKLIPYNYKDLDLKSLFYQIMQIIPYTLILQAIKMETDQPE